MSGRGHTIRGIVLLAHGCSHHAIDFFPRSPSCPKCIGLPEELRMSNGLLRQQYAVVAISSAGHCWGEEDFPRVQKVLGIISSELGAGLPRYAVGASSGGSFVAHLPNFVSGIKAVVRISPRIIFTCFYFSQTHIGNSNYVCSWKDFAAR